MVTGPGNPGALPGGSPKAWAQSQTQSQGPKAEPQDAFSCSLPHPSPQTQAAAPSPWGTANRSAPKVLPDTLPSISLAQFHPFAPSMLVHEGIERRRHLSLLNPQGILKSCLNPRAVLKSSSLLFGGWGGSWWRPMTGRRAPSFNPGSHL